MSKLFNRIALPVVMLAAAALVSPQAVLAQDSPVEGSKPMAVVAVSSYDELLGDIKFIGNLVERPELGGMLEGGVAMFTQGKGLAGLDKTKSWGVVVMANQGDIQPLGFLPVTDLDELLGVLAPIAGEATKGDDGVYTMQAGPQQVFLKAAGGWAFISNTSEGLAQAPADPTAVLGGLDKNYDLAVRLNVQNIPEMFRQMAVDQIKQGVELGMERQPDESDEEFAMRTAIVKNQMKQLTSLINDTDALTLGYAIDAQAEKTYFDISMTGVPGSKFARQAAQIAAAKTAFGGFLADDAAVTLNFVSDASSPEDIEQAVAMLDVARQRAMKAIDEESELPEGVARDTVKSALGDVMDALTATVKGGRFDAGGMVDLKPGSLTVAFGGHVVDAGKLEDAMKKLEELAKQEEDFDGVTWNAANHAGIAFHTMQVPMDDEEAQKLLGDKLDVVVGIGEKQFYVAFGKSALDTLKSVIDKSKADAGNDVPPMQIVVSAGKIAEFIAAQEDDPGAKMIADVLSQSGGKDHVRATVTGIENGINYRIEAEEGVLKAIGKAGEAGARIEGDPADF